MEAFPAFRGLNLGCSVWPFAAGSEEERLNSEPSAGESDEPARETAQRSFWRAGFLRMVLGVIFAMIARRRFWPHQRFAVGKPDPPSEGVTHGSTVDAACPGCRPIWKRWLSSRPEQALEGTRLEIWSCPVAPRWTCWRADRRDGWRLRAPA